MTRYHYDAAVRWSDLDAYGHVNNARFLTLYEEARVAMFFTGARAQGLTSFEKGIVIARHEVDYLRPVDYGHPVRIEMWIAELRASRFTVASPVANPTFSAPKSRHNARNFSFTSALIGQV